jgi:hypothetical protein
MVPPIDHRQPNLLPPKRARRLDPTEPTTDDHDMRSRVIHSNDRIRARKTARPEIVNAGLRAPHPRQG